MSPLTRVNGGEIQYSLLAHCHVRVSVLFCFLKLLPLRWKFRWIWALRSSSNSSSSTVIYSYDNTIPTLWDTSKHRFSVRRTPIDGLCLWPEKLRVKRITHSEERRRRDATAHLEINVFNSYPSSSRARSNQKGFRLEVKSCMFSVIHQIKMPQPHILHMCYIVYNGMM